MEEVKSEIIGEASKTVPILVKKIGNTTIKFFDTYCKDNSMEETQQIIRRIEEMGVRALAKQMSPKISQ